MPGCSGRQTSFVIDILNITHSVGLSAPADCASGRRRGDVPASTCHEEQAAAAARASIGAARHG